jgi:lysophospholipase L1-like esterase
MSLLSLVITTVFAAEIVISPLSDNIPMIPQPARSFGALQTPSPTPIPTRAPTPSSTPVPSPTIQTYQTPTSHYTIALLGDSMIDTLGPDAPQLKDLLTTVFPHTAFEILNYGVGATNIDYGLERLTNQYTYLGNDILPLVSRAPDIVVVESFGYNPYPFELGGIEKHWIQLATIINSLKTKLPGVKIIIAATIAPNSNVFGDGAPGLSFSPEDKQKRTTTIKQYLESTIAFARGEHLPLADVYHASLDSTGNGILKYINPGDHIHYSDAGRTLFAQKIVDTIIANHLLN